MRNSFTLFRVAFILTCLSCSLQSTAQEKINNIVDALKQHRKQVLQEKVYVHVDQAVVLTGETMWFKIYVVDASFHRPVNLSKVAYLELLDGSSKPVLQTKIALKEDGGSGYLFIPATLNSGNYQLRAYTQWMKNFSADFYFHKKISIINPFIGTPSEVVTVPQDRSQVELFPEGGDLVEGLKSKIAFKITNSSAQGIKGTLLILDGQQDTIIHTKPVLFGMGKFYFTPKENERYKAVLIDAAGRISSFRLPEIKKAGYVMEVKDTTDHSLHIRINQSKLTGQDRDDSYVYLLIHARQTNIYAAVKQMNSSDAVFTVDKDKLPDGISHFTIFNDQGIPVCERLYFTPPKNELTIQVVPDQKQYTPRKKVSLSLNALVNQQSVSSSLSITVYKLDSLAEKRSGGIHEYLFLSSDLNGNIEFPEYYFDTNNPDVHEARDLLMLTHGWRRFTWSDILKQKPVLTYVPEYRSHVVTGKILTNDGEPVNGVLTSLSSPGKNIQLYISRSNDKGEINFETLNFYGPRKLIVQTDDQDSTYQFQMDSPFSTEYALRPVPSLSLNDGHEDALVSRSVGMQVQDIFHRQPSNPVRSVAADTLPFYGKADQYFLLDDFTRFPVMEEVMREYVPGVFVRKRRDGFHFMVADTEKKGFLLDDPLVLLDGVPIDVDKIMAFDPLKIKKLDVVTRNFYVGRTWYPGIVSYATYQNDLAGFDVGANGIVIDYEGLQQQREFYSPVYNTGKERSSRIPDQRNRLFWSSDIQTSDGDKKVIDFFTSDVQGTFRVVVEGLTKNGNSGSGQCTFSVKEMKLN